MRVYEFIEPHITGGHATIRITEQQIIRFMKERLASFPEKNLSDRELLESFIADYWCREIEYGD